jgi:hypothetical protein
MSSNSRGQDWAAPPDGILLRILSLVNKRTRFKAALVNLQWSKAAAAAITTITCTPRSSTAVGSLQQYLGKHGQHLTYLFLEQARYNRGGRQEFLLKQLPCPNLLEFQFAQLLPDSSAQHLLQAATALTSLSLKVTGEVPGFYPSLSLLTDLRQLKNLDISLHSDRDEDEPPAEQQEYMDGALLVQLSQLTRLKLQTHYVSARCATAAA